MELNELLDVMDRASANLAKLEQIWVRAEPMIPNSAIWITTSTEYEDLARDWNDLLTGLPPIDGWTMSVELPDPAGIGRALIDYLDIGEPAYPVFEETTAPGRQLAEYRHRLGKARRRAIRRRLEDLTAQVDATLPAIVAGIPRDSTDELNNDQVTIVRGAVTEIERLIGDSVQRSARWGDLHRHFYFSQGHDWHDIVEFDWPIVRPDVLAAATDPADPLGVPNIDLGVAAASNPTGGVATALAWASIDASDFERLLYVLLGSLDGFQNVQWLMHSNAADRGRDLSVERVLTDGSGAVRTERVIVQAKHWLSKSVGVDEISTNVAQMKLWEPPLVDGLITATSGRFTTDAVSWVENHNQRGVAPRVELWPDSKLESLLSSHPEIAPVFKLR